jgi:hypothetical protein
MDQHSKSTSQEQGMKEWAEGLRSCPYPGGSAGYFALNFFATTSIWTAVLAAPLMIWFERRARKGRHVS